MIKTTNSYALSIRGSYRIAGTFLDLGNTSYKREHLDPERLLQNCTEFAKLTWLRANCIKVNYGMSAYLLLAWFNNGNLWNKCIHSTSDMWVIITMRLSLRPQRQLLQKKQVCSMVMALLQNKITQTRINSRRTPFGLPLGQPTSPAISHYLRIAHIVFSRYLLGPTLEHGSTISSECALINVEHGTQMTNLCGPGTAPTRSHRSCKISLWIAISSLWWCRAFWRSISSPKGSRTCHSCGRNGNMLRKACLNWIWMDCEANCPGQGFPDSCPNMWKTCISMISASR